VSHKMKYEHRGNVDYYLGGGEVRVLETDVRHLNRSREGLREERATIKNSHKKSRMIRFNAQKKERPQRKGQAKRENDLDTKEARKNSGNRPVGKRVCEKNKRDEKPA